MERPEQHVGIRELRHDFRSFVDRVMQGERFIITDRGTPVGELVPHRSSMTVIDRMIAEGRAIPATRRIGLGFTPTGNVSTDVSDELLKMRDEERQI